MKAETAVEQTYSRLLIKQWEQINEKVAVLAEAFPEKKYDFKPNENVRTFGSVLRHLAFWNQYVEKTARGMQMDGTPNELPRDEYPEKAQVIKILRRTAADAASALQQRMTETELDIAELCASFTGHSAEHYGQLAVYCRLNGIVPPASRAEG